MAWSTPKVDWVATDYFNIEDWERVRGNIEALQVYLSQLQFGRFELQSLATPRGINELPTVTLVNRLESGLRAAYHLVQGAVPDWQSGPVWYARLDSQYNRNPTFKDWNRWERSIEQVRLWAPQNVAAQPRSGEFYAGEV